MATTRETHMMHLAPMSMTRMLTIGAVAAASLMLSQPARADAVAALRAFVKDVDAGRGSFVQTVTSQDGKKSRQSRGTLEFQRPNRFRFSYTAPTEQLIVGDGKQVWLYDTDLNQVTVRPMSQALGATPAALLAGASLDKDFTLKKRTRWNGWRPCRATKRGNSNPCASDSGAVS